MEKIYAVTITLKPNQYRYKVTEQAEKAKLEMIKLGIKGSFCFEFTKSGNIHLHGVMKALKPLRIQDQFRVSKIFGGTYVTPAYDMKKWITEYLTKDQDEVIEELGYRIVQDDLNVFKQEITDYVQEFQIDMQKVLKKHEHKVKINGMLTATVEDDDTFDYDMYFNEND